MADDDSKDEWVERRARLDAKLGQHRARKQAEESADTGRGSMQGMAQGLKIASEFVAGIAVGGFIGYGIDYFLGTGPFGLIIFLLLGFAAGALNVVRGSSTPSGSGRDT